MMEDLCVRKQSMNTYTAEDLMQILRLGKTAVYDLIKKSYKNE